MSWKFIFYFVLIADFTAYLDCDSQKILTPYQSNDFVWIYKPEGDTFPGPTTNQLEAGKWYEEWVVNDHTFVKGPDGRWHLFGITHPKTTTDAIHEGEFLSFHAISAEANFREWVKKHSWADLAKVLPPAERPGERLENHAPYVIKRDDLYYMVYGPSPIRLAVSTDLMTWQLKGAFFSEAKGARDPGLLYYKNTYYLVYCTERKVNIRSSKDLLQWSDPTAIYESQDFDPESPSLIRYNSNFYLVLCAWDGIWDRKEIEGVYQHKTYVYQSDDKMIFDASKPITTLNAHALEIFQGEDGQWYMSSVEWPNRGVSVDRIEWK